MCSSRRALRAALAIQQRVQDEISHVVWASGSTPARRFQGAGYRGGALNMAARLCSLAEPGQDRERGGDAPYATLTAFAICTPIKRLKGIEKPVRVVRSSPCSAVRSAGYGARARPPVGRPSSPSPCCRRRRGSCSAGARPRPRRSPQIQPGSVGVFDAATHSRLPSRWAATSTTSSGRGRSGPSSKGGTVVKIDPKRFTVGGGSPSEGWWAGSWRRSCLGLLGGGHRKDRPAFSTTTWIRSTDVTPGWDLTRSGHRRR